VAESYIGGVVEAKGEGGCGGCVCGYEGRAWGAVAEVVKVIFWLGLDGLGQLLGVNTDQRDSFTYAALRDYGHRLMYDDSEDVPDDFQMATLTSTMVNNCHLLSVISLTYLFHTRV
jgi:hypothetical protein